MENLTILKRTYTTRLFVAAAFLLYGLCAYAQSNPSAVTAIIDQLPAATAPEAQRHYRALINLGESNIVALCDMVTPNGNASGVKARYGVSLLTHTVVDARERELIERAYLAALKKASDNEVKAYLITNLGQIGSARAVPDLAAYIDSDVFDPAIGAMLTIGSIEVPSTLLNALPGKSKDKQLKIVKSLGQLKYQPAVGAITPLLSDSDDGLQRQALWALAMIGDPASSSALLSKAKSEGFKYSADGATNALVEYMHQLTQKKDAKTTQSIAQAILAGANDASQQQFRLAALEALATTGQADVKLFSAEAAKYDAIYQKEVYKLAAQSASTPAALKGWLKAYKKSNGASQANLLSMLAGTGDAFRDNQVVAALSATSPEVRATAANLLAATRNKKYVGPLLDYLGRSNGGGDVAAASNALKQLISVEDGNVIAQRLSLAGPAQQAALVKLLAARGASSQFGAIKALTTSPVDSIRGAAYSALPQVASATDVDALLPLLAQAKGSDLKNVQAALSQVVSAASASKVLDAYEGNKQALLPVLPYTPDDSSLDKVITAFGGSDTALKDAAFSALTSWTNGKAIRTLLKIAKDPSATAYRERAITGALNQITKSALPDDQKLLLVRDAMSAAVTKNEQAAALRAAGSIRTFLSFVFVSEYLDDAELGSAASRSAMMVALPASDGRPGLTGVEVRKVLQKMTDKLTGPDSQYERIDILTYLENLPYVTGYESIFNGKDLSGWQGLVEDPVKRAKMTPAVLAKKQQEANAKVKNNWSVKDGMIVFQGDGANLCTTRAYGDFEMLVDWKISRHGDSGIYLRGSPQVQIWDTSRVDVGAQVGSGGLYNNEKGRSTPLVVADNPVGEWNTFRIRMLGDRVWVHLNGILVVDSVVLENYWDRKLPIFPEEAIELQAHGTDLAFRNIYVKEINPKPYAISAEEMKTGFVPLFNGKDLDNWVGNKTDYVVEGNTIALYPGEKSHGNLYTANEYGDFVLRFAFQLTPGANNGLGIHAPLDGDAAYVGKELQILDNTSPQYAQLQPWQFHGSVYGIMPAKRDYLKPVGEWNEQEVYVKGSFIRITLNGTVILEGDMKKASAKGTVDKKDHPGLQRWRGHIGFLGHGSVVRFKDLRIRELK